MLRRVEVELNEAAGAPNWYTGKGHGILFLDADFTFS